MISGLHSCKPEECSACLEEAQPSTLTLNLLADATRTTSVQTQDEDNMINTLDVFIFNNGRLDTYRRFTGEELENLTLSTTTGQKTICVIANPHIDSYAGVTDLNSFRTLTADLRKESLGDFTMYGETEEDLGLTATVDISISRFVSRVEVSYIRTDFEDTPFEGMNLTDCRLYLINASGNKVISDESTPSSPLILNLNGLIEEDAGSTAERGLLMDILPENIGNAGYNTPHYLYCYSNETEDISSCTKLILEAELDGVTYYYPIPVNQPGYGDPGSYGHNGIRRNTAYSYGIVITRPGSPDPAVPLEPGDLELSIEVADWTFVPVFEKRF